MKQAKNNDVDLLLRSHARTRDDSPLQSGSSSGDGYRATSDHLDADELNSYAEGVVPPPARARYSEHLVDCDVCRGIVVGLTSAAGAAIRSEETVQKSGLSFWQNLASLFSPAVLRYAVPALVLTAVIGISLLSMWQRRQPEFIAKNQAAGARTSTDQLKQTESPTGQPSGEAPETIQKGTESPASTNSLREKKTLRGNESAASGAGTGTGVFGRIDPMAKEAGRPEESVSGAEVRPSYAPEPKAGAPAPSASAVTDVGKSTQGAKEQPAKRENQERLRDAYKNTPSDEDRPNRSAAPTTAVAPQSNRQLGGLSAARRSPSGQDKKDKAGEVETRTVSGRRFAREDNAWVDTAYDSSRTPIRVGRGSEQFRALVADEPGLRAIAEQLNGVVIVVWKNRAYRIQ